MNLDNLHKAVVIDNKAVPPDGSVQIYVESIMSGWKTEDYPWALPFSQFTGGGTKQGLGAIPENKSKIWVFAEKPRAFKNWFYFGDVVLTDLNCFLSAATAMSSHGISAEYPDAKFMLLKNDVIIGASSNAGSPEIFLLHPGGHHVIIDKDGVKVETKSAKDVKIKSSGEIKAESTKDSTYKSGAKLNIQSSSGIEIKTGSSPSTEKMTLGETLKKLLDDWLKITISHSHPTLFGPTGPPVQASKYSQIKSKLMTILSDNNKNN